MSAVPAGAVPAGAPVPPRPAAAWPLAATAYFWLVVMAAVAATTPLLTRLSAHTHGLAAFALLGAAVAIAQIFVVDSPASQAYHTTAVFLVAAALVLPPELVALVAVVQHVPDWLRRRLQFQTQVFNIASFTLAALATWGAADVVRRSLPAGAGEAQAALTGAAACAAFVGVNHALLAPMLRFARGHSLRESGLFGYANLSTDAVLAALGVGVAALWRTDVWLTPFVLAPLLLVHRSLAVPALQAEARLDPKTGLFNARHFAAALREELGRAIRFERPLALLMADLDLLRDINNTYGHLAGDAVLAGVARIFRQQLRAYDVPARFGGEEFSILLPETGVEEALEIAERIRRAVAAAEFAVATAGEPIRATVSIGVAGYPRDGAEPNELVHQADLAVYRAKLQGRNRVVSSTREAPLAHPDGPSAKLLDLHAGAEAPLVALAPADPVVPSVDRRAATRRARSRPYLHAGPRFLAIGRRLGVFVLAVGLAGTAAGLDAAIRGGARLDLGGLVALVALVGAGQALSIEVDRLGSISVSAVGALAGAALLGPRAALPLALTMSVVEWSARRARLHQVVFNVGTLTLASLAAAELFAVAPGGGGLARVGYVAFGVAAGAAYFAVNTGLVAAAVALEGGGRASRLWRERLAWLALHYVVYGFVAAMIRVAYGSIGIWSLAVFSVPLFLMREAQDAYLRRSERASRRLREEAETIRSRNLTLERANRLLRERSTAAMESLSETVEARDAAAAGHSRRVQRLAVAIARELGLSAAELDVVGLAALFHDIGKLAVPDAILLKPAHLSDEEWELMRRHAEEGASIIDRLGFLSDAVPAIRHHHERYDGSGYPGRLAGEEIPLGARIVHVADAFDSMLSGRAYSRARTLEDALAELRRHAGTQFCPRCVSALERLAARGELEAVRSAALSAA